MTTNDAMVAAMMCLLRRIEKGLIWWALSDLNRRLSRYERGALTTELKARNGGSTGDRTRNLRIKSPMLYRLSYGPILLKLVRFVFCVFVFGNYNAAFF